MRGQHRKRNSGVLPILNKFRCTLFFRTHHHVIALYTRMTKLLSPIPASLTTTVAFFATAWLVYQQRRVRRGERSTVFPRLLPSPSSSDRDKFVGAWILSSYHVDDTVTGDRIHPLGHDADGLIVRLHRARRNNE